VLKRLRSAKPEPQAQLPPSPQKSAAERQPLHGSTAAVPAGVCADCGAPATGNYCAHCGQETKIETPTIRHFLHELADQYVAVEGKLGRTLRVLFSQPGQLTVDYVEGRRQRYVRPLKLYLSVSVVFFGLMGLLPDNSNGSIVNLDDDKPVQQQDQGKPAPATPAVADASKKAARDDDDDDSDNDNDKKDDSAKKDEDDKKQQGEEAQKELAAAKAEMKKDLKDGDVGSAGAKLGEAGADFGDKLSKALETKSAGFAKLPPAEQRREVREKISDDAPYTMFFLLPYFALLLRWLYRKNQLRYGVHLLFSLHLHCFAFIVMAIGLLPMPSQIGTLLFWGVAAYLVMALHRVYGGTWKRTIWRTFVLGAIYMATVGGTILSTVLTTVFGTKA
jgi:uncharacterized protein DUF3667